MSKGTKIFLAVIIFFMGLFLVAVITIGFKFSKSTPKVAEGSVVVFDISGDIPEVIPPDPFTQLFNKNMMSVHEITESIKYAATDDKVKAVIIRPYFPSIGWAKAQEIASAINEYRKSNKPLISYFEFGTNMDYYLASGATKVYGAPTGMLMLNGIMAEVPFFKGLLDKLGVEAEMQHVGDYKSYSDIFTRDNISDAHKEMANWLLDSIQSQLVAQIQKSRNLSKEKVMELINLGFFDNQKAVKEKLIDGTLYWDEIENQYAQGDKKKLMWAFSYYKSIKSELKGRGSKIALLYAIGSIESGKGQPGKSIGSDTLSSWIREAYKDKDIKAIVMRVDSPGGSGIASDAIWREVMNAKKAKKPFIVSMSDVAGSGGYYIAMGADAIFAQKSTLTGSIGVITGKFYLNGLWEKLGIHIEVIKKAENADLFSSTTHFTDTQKKIIEENMNTFYKVFTEKAASGRKMTIEQIDARGRGRVWTGEQAKENHLIDAIGGLNDAIEYAKKMANISQKEKVTLVVYPKKKTLFEALMEMENFNDVFVPEKLKAYYQMEHMLTVFSREPYLAIMPPIRFSR